MRNDLNILNEKAGFFEQEHGLLLEFKRVNLPLLSRMEEDILALTNELKQAAVTNTLTS